MEYKRILNRSIRTPDELKLRPTNELKLRRHGLVLGLPIRLRWNAP